MHPSCTLLTKSSHPGARLEEVFARGQRIGGGKKVQRIGTACRKCTTSCSQLALEIDFGTMIPSMNFIHLIQSPNSFIQDNLNVVTWIQLTLELYFAQDRLQTPFVILRKTVD